MLTKSFDVIDDEKVVEISTLSRELDICRESRMAKMPRLVVASIAAIGLFTGFISSQSADRLSTEPLDDVTLIGATFLGGSGADDAYETSIAVADDSSIYITGFSASTDFPVTPDAFNTAFSGGVTDRFISRFESGLTQMPASTYIGSAGVSAGFIGGNGDDVGHAIGIDGAGNVFIAGYTESADYPVTDHGFDTEYNGGRDVFISKFDSGLTTLLASTFVGGSGDEGYRWPRIDMAVTDTGDVIVVGITHSVDFPVTASAFDREFNGGTQSGDAFIVVLDNSLSTLKASTFLGGSHDEWRLAVHAIEGGGVLVCGETESSDFPTSVNAYDRTLNVLKDVFIARLDDKLSALEASTLFGGSKLDEALDIELSTSGEILITGYTESEDLPVTPGSYSHAWAGGKRDGYAAKFDSDLTTLVSSTFFGGSAVDFPRGLAFDHEGNVYITGNTTSPDFPVTDNNLRVGYRGGSSRGDVFMLIFDASLRDMKYSALIGGTSEDTGFCIDVDARGRIVVAGSTNSADFPMGTSSFDDTYNGGANDSFVLQFSGMR
jgi:hypothetical protein